MHKMIGISMMVIGLLMLGSGYYVFSMNANNSQFNDEILGIIYAVTADGVVTPNEKTVLNNVADKYKVDRETVYQHVEDILSSVEFDAETEIIDQSKKKGDDFEKFIIKKFNQKNFKIKQWAGDKYVDGIFSEKTQQPDIIVEFNYDDYVRTVAVECKWRSKEENGKIYFSYKDQLLRYKDFQNNESIDVYIALGIGGKAYAPNELYLIPLKELKYPYITVGKLIKYKKQVNDNFYFKMKYAVLDIRD